MIDILLIHGLNGSGDHSSTGKTLKKAFGGAVHTPNMPNNPADWYDFLVDYIGQNFADQPLVLVGNSTGGLLASCLAHAYNLGLVLINPVIDAADLGPFTGLNTKFASGEQWLFTDEDVASLQQYDVPEPALPALVFLGRNDEVLDFQKTAGRYAQGSKVIINDNSHQYRLSETDLGLLQEFCSEKETSGLENKNM